MEMTKNDKHNGKGSATDKKTTKNDQKKRQKMAKQKTKTTNHDKKKRQTNGWSQFPGARPKPKLLLEDILLFPTNKVRVGQPQRGAEG